MLIDGRRYPAGETLNCDLAIIGGGMAGLTIAAEMAGHGLDIVVLEAGGVAPAAASQEFFHGEVNSPAHPTPEMYRQRRLGGSSTIWGGRCVPFDPIDFEARPYMALPGWPIGRSALEPYYRRAQQVLDAGQFEYSARLALGRGALIDGFDDPNISTDSIERYSLPTNLWAKLGKRLAAESNLRVIYNAACVAIDSSEGGRLIQSVGVADPEGRRTEVRARQYVVAVGGIETVRILAHAGPSRHPLGQGGAMLGRGYMCHVEMAVGTLVLNPTSRRVSHGFERTSDGVYARRRFTLRDERQRKLRVLNAMARLHHTNAVDHRHRDAILSLMYLAKNTVIPEYRRKLSMIEHAIAGDLPHDAHFWAAHLGNVVRGLPRAVGFAVEWVIKRHLSTRKLPYVALHNAAGRYALDVNTEQEPNPASRVTHTDQLDRHGIPRARIDWRLSDLDVRTVIAFYTDLAAALAVSGTARLEFDPSRLEEQAREAVPVGGHHIGTARMAESPAHGVVDAECRVFGVENLHVAGAAVLPTSSHANPSLTLMALALRLSDRLGDLLRRAK